MAVRPPLRVAAFPTDSAEPDLRSETSTLFNATAFAFFPGANRIAALLSPVAAPHRCFPTPTSGSFFCLSSCTLPGDISHKTQTGNKANQHRLQLLVSYLNPDVECRPAASQTELQYLDVSHLPETEQKRAGQTLFTSLNMNKSFYRCCSCFGGWTWTLAPPAGLPE